MGWKIRNWLDKTKPLWIALIVGYFGFSLYKNGIFRRGVGPAVSRTVRQIPIVGSLFKSGRREYGYSKRHHRKHTARHKKRKRRHW